MAQPKLSDVLFLLMANVALFFVITIGCYELHLPVWVAGIAAAAAIVFFTKYAVREISKADRA